MKRASSNTPFCLHVAYHEAGHAVAAMRLLHGFHSARVLPTGQTSFVDRKGVQRTGLVGNVDTGNAFNHPPTLSSMLDVPVENRADLFDWGIRHIVVDLAGPFSEARHSGRSRLWALEIGGDRDWADVSRIARFLVPDERDCGRLLLAAESLTGKLVKTDWAVISAIAERLATYGEMDGSDPILAGVERVREPLVDARWSDSSVAWAWRRQRRAQPG